MLLPLTPRTVYLIIPIHLAQFGRPNIKLIFPNEQYKISFKNVLQTFSKPFQNNWRHNLFKCETMTSSDGRAGIICKFKHKTK